MGAIFFHFYQLWGGPYFFIPSGYIGAPLFQCFFIWGGAHGVGYTYGIVATVGYPTHLLLPYIIPYNTNILLLQGTGQGIPRDSHIFSLFSPYSNDGGGVRFLIGSFHIPLP